MADEAVVGDVTARIRFYMDSDPLDFRKTGRAVLVMEDNYAEIPLPAGPPGKQGPRGEPGSSLRPDLVLDETEDSDAMKKLQERSATWRSTGVDKDGYFAINKPTKTGFFYTRGGWTVIRDIFGGGSEIVAGEFTFPTNLRNVTKTPPAPADGILLYCEGNQLKAKKSDGSTTVLF